MVATRVAPTMLPAEFTPTRPTIVRTRDPRANDPAAWRLRRASVSKRMVMWSKAVFKEALNVMLMVLRNAAASCFCAWISNFFFSLGDPFVWSSHNQSTASLIMTNLLWTNVIFCSLMVVAHTAVLLPLRFISDPDKPPTPWFCIKQLVRASYVYFVFSFVLSAIVGLFVGRMLPSNVRNYKIDFYLGNLVTHHYSIGIDIATRTIFKTQTVEGQQWSRLREQRTCRPARASTRASVYWKAFVKGGSKLVPMLFSGAYVHIVNQTDLFSHGHRTLTFVVITTATKVFIQTAIKMYVIKYRVKNIRTMCVLVGLPTVLIDTQVRIMLLCQQSYSFAVNGLVAMATIKIVIRGVKARLLSMELQRRQSKFQSSVVQEHTSHISGNFIALMSTVDERAASSPLHPPIASEQRDIEQLREVIYRFHAAEVSADMHAGYIAIGCSASIWFFYSDHPHYDLGIRTSQSNSLLSRAPLLPIQVGIEIVADYIASVLEISAGVDFKSMDRFGLFLALVFIVHAILNIAISANLYLQ